MSLLEKNTTKKGYIDENATQLKFKKSNKEMYKIEQIFNSLFYAMKLEADHLLGFYYLVWWKSYLKEENT